METPSYSLGNEIPVTMWRLIEPFIIALLAVHSGANDPHPAGAAGPGPLPFAHVDLGLCQIEITFFCGGQ